MTNHCNVKTKTKVRDGIYEPDTDKWLVNVKD